MSDYLNEEEQVARMKSWWGDNGTSVMVAIAVSVVTIVGWQWYGSYTQDRAYEASRIYADFQSSSEAEKSAAAAALSNDHAGSAYHTFVLFHQAQEALATRDLALAEGHLQTVIEQADDDLLVDLARVRLAKIQHALDRSSQALETLASLSEAGYRAWGLETKGDIHVSRGEIQLAHAAYEAAIESLEEGDSRPILDMKLKNVAPFQGEYVQFADTLETALKDAQEIIDQNIVVDLNSAADEASDTDPGLADVEEASTSIDNTNTEKTTGEASTAEDSNDD